MGIASGASVFFGFHDPVSLFLFVERVIRSGTELL